MAFLGNVMSSHGRSKRSARGQGCLLLGSGRVIAATGAGRHVRNLAGPIRVVAHDVSPKEMPRKKGVRGAEAYLTDVF